MGQQVSYLETWGQKTNRWQTVKANAYSSVLRDKVSQLEAQQFTVEYQIVRDNYQLYELRRKYDYFFVGIRGVIIPKQLSLCMKTQQLNVLVQVIPYRLSDLGVISFQEAMFILKVVLQGCLLLRKHNIGFYLIDETNICFNQKGQCKFWINQNLQLALPSVSRLVTQDAFLRDLLTCIEKRIDCLNQAYLEQKQKFRQLTIQKVLRLVDSYTETQLKRMPSIVFLNQNKENTCSKISLSRYGSEKKQNRRNKKIDEILVKSNKLSLNKRIGKSQIFQSRSTEWFRSANKLSRFTVNPEVVSLVKIKRNR